MKSWIYNALFAATVLAIVPCQAGVRRCLINVFCDKLEVIGEGLYVRPHTCDLDYAIEDRTDSGQPTAADVTPTLPIDLELPSGKEHDVCPDYTGAFRIGARYLFDCSCNDIAAIYSTLWSRDRRSLTVPGQQGIWITDGHPRYNSFRLNNAIVAELVGTTPSGPINAAAHSRVNFQYHMVDLVIGGRWCFGACMQLRGTIGLRWASIYLLQRTNYRGTTTTAGDNNVGTPQRLFFQHISSVRDKSYTWGIGPRVGIELRYKVACGIGIGAQMGGSIIVGESSEDMVQGVSRQNIVAGLIPGEFPNVNEGIVLHNRAGCHLLPEWDARLGLNYEWCCGCFSLLGEVGWEFVSYVNALSRLRFNHDGGTGRSVCESFNIDGLYVALRLAV